MSEVRSPRTMAGTSERTHMPTGTIDHLAQHSFTAPPFEQASVVDAMRVGIVSCPPETPLRDVARIMATYRIHCVVVSEMEGATPTGVIADTDLAVAASSGSRTANAGQLARTEPVSVAADDSLERAAQLMAEHEVSHLVVIQPHSSNPVGVLSALDLAGVLAWGGSA
jgi:CBS domain-containing protein